MVRPIEKEGERKNYYLDKHTIKTIKYASSLNDCSASQFIDYLASQWRYELNPVEELKNLNEKKKKLKEELNELENKEQEVIKRMETIHKWQLEKKKKKPHAIENIARKIMNREHMDAESLAKNWSRMLGVPATQLIFEAMEKIKESGV